mmetsp:Transcript_3469/g.5013  ORF Transcript_3469/g.5013 Transcript_3469/m.5013 type:complete len:131 (-) Transcript_3469:1456-1848(-)|eukprot:CAMPEP_0203752642 /NCGR_PEP_ID=MMETSP0098-20131031/6534_1 /ASSEMBLY_ACC=CAM_ASM_000208 /TAXON_ID=96639 /ORGANISM=" , Strain NY0313808BC1" /LENGTH=130 /DNA_ID=CAMNT_0050642895 /DNA_START=18 /DNA_END=410 /DNA_ORIENTATION=-
MASSFAETSEEVEVRKEDQERINQFGIYHKRGKELDEERKDLNEKLAFIEDAEQEVMLADGDSDSFLVKLGSTFVSVDEDEFNEFLEKKRSEYDTALEKINAECDDLEQKRTALKSTLYARFGSTINLDD